MKTTVIYHATDFDGIFCREIAKKFLPDAELIGWDFAEDPLPIPDGQIYILDLPVDRVFGYDFSKRTAPPGPPAKVDEVLSRIIWIDHHKTAIDSHPADIPGYRIDGVAACRLAWQWFSAGEAMGDCNCAKNFGKSAYVDRVVNEPRAVRLAGEYDIWDKRDFWAEVFQFGLRSREIGELGWRQLLNPAPINTFVEDLLNAGLMLQRYQQQIDASVVSHLSFLVEFEGLRFLCINSARFNSLTFSCLDFPESGHDALMGFKFDGRRWLFSLYHAKHNTDLDLSIIAKRYGGGGHRGACGFNLTDPSPVLKGCLGAPNR